ncbi:hypothetical protein IP88_07495 [alpha proteobacterium AAP81b]|nr:hypothetical protein IP88_07495 [alpha proteobacterium AAP81b]
MMKLITKLAKNTNGASAAEYALIVAVLGGLVIAGATAFGGGLNTAMDNNGKAMTKAADGTF